MSATRPTRRTLIGALPALALPGCRRGNAAQVEAAARSMVVPSALRRRLPRVEASGLAWCATLDRYLVVIDDTIDDQENERRAPIVLTADREGRFDERPLSIDGIERLDDAESICAAGRLDGADRFFLLTSHALTKKGRERASRRQLLDLRFADGKLRAAARVDLAEGPGGIPALLATAGVAAIGGFDAEAIAYHDGALLVGLKAPLDEKGAAMVVRLGTPDRVFASAKLAQGQASIAHRARLPVGATRVCEGFSDLAFGADGTLFATANAPKGGPSDGGGALWSIGAGGKPQLLARFPDLKPEGLSPTPDGRALAVVFDRGDAQPWWTTWPLRA